MTTRRDFVKGAAAVAAGAILPNSRVPLPTSNAATIRVGLVGCGGRGTGAARDCLRASEGVELVAMGDCSRSPRVGQDQSRQAADRGREIQGHRQQQLQRVRRLSEVIDSGIDMVLLATPPAFRPQPPRGSHSRGQACFMEKPVQWMLRGSARCSASSELARQKSLGLVAARSGGTTPGPRRDRARARRGHRRRRVGAVYWNQAGSG